MREEKEHSGLYWHGGPFQAKVHDIRSLPEETNSEVMALLEEFLVACQQYYFAFYSAMTGIQTQHERYEKILQPANKDKAFFIGSAFPNAEQSPGSSTIAMMNQGELLESLKKGGVFENHHAKALVVVIFHIWDETYRPRIAEALSVKPKQVECALMGDIRQVRNLIIHEKSIIPGWFSANLELLPKIWTLESGELRITEEMVHSWMEQLNAIRLRITDPKP